MTLAKVIHAWRRQEELSLRQAAEHIGVDRNALYRLERGEGIGLTATAVLIRWLFT